MDVIFLKETLVSTTSTIITISDHHILQMPEWIGELRYNTLKLQRLITPGEDTILESGSHGWRLQSFYGDFIYCSSQANVIIMNVSPSDYP